VACLVRNLRLVVSNKIVSIQSFLAEAEDIGVS